MKNDNLTTISDIVKVYPHMLKIIIYRNDYVLDISHNPRPRRPRDRVENADRSIRRTRSVISDIIACNQFDLWCTFTFNCKNCPTGCNNWRKGKQFQKCTCPRDQCRRFDPDICKLRMTSWLHRQKLKNPHFAYLIVPEFHKSGAVHFHAFIKNCSSKLTDTKKVDNGHPVFKFSGFTLGFSYVIDISNGNDSDHNTIANYMQKYITKDMPQFHGRKRYFASQGLPRPLSQVNGVTKFGLNGLIFGYKNTYATSEFEIQHHPISGMTALDYHNQIALDIGDIPTVNRPRRSRSPHSLRVGSH